MLPTYLVSNLDFFEDRHYKKLENGDIIEFKEDTSSGAARIKCKINSDAVVFRNPQVFQLLNSNTDTRKCADYIFFTKGANNKWKLHLLEFKKTVGMEEYLKSIKQLQMGLYNARAIAGFLNIHINTIILYSAYRKEKLSQNRAPIEARAANVVFKKGTATLTIDGKESNYRHQKIKLDANGNGTYTI